MAFQRKSQTKSVSAKMQRCNYITMLGTGNALATHYYNTCFTLHGQRGTILLVDAGGGNGILTQLERAGIDFRSIHHLFITHAHTDHILGGIWMIRMALQFRYTFHVWSHEKVLKVLKSICCDVLPSKDIAGMGNLVKLHLLDDKDKFDVGEFKLQCFDIHSAKERQFGFTTQIHDGKRLCCLGDEPFNQSCLIYAENSEWLMSEAFCLYEDRERFDPYEKSHSTVLDAARIAERLHVANLILYHTEDQTLETRRERYTAESLKVFSGKVYVPNDLDRIMLSDAI